MDVSGETVEKLTYHNMYDYPGGQIETYKGWTGPGKFIAQGGSYVPLAYVPIRREVLTMLLSVDSQVQGIIEKINGLENRVSTLEKGISSVGMIEISESNPIEGNIRITKTEARKKILKHFQLRGELDYFDIVEDLGLDLKFVVEICEELENEKEIKAVK